jgi:hypothetical protein
VEQENPSACATADCKVSEREIELYCHCISVIYERVCNQLLINPIIRTRTRLISGIHATIYRTIIFPRITGFLNFVQYSENSSSF